MIVIKNMKLPEECKKCFAFGKCGDCILLEKTGLDVGIAEFDEEWFKALREHRRLKFCPMESIDSVNIKTNYNNTKEII